jgi:hypothetical protein
MPKLGVDNHAPRNNQFRVWVLRTQDAKEIVPLVKMGVNPHVGLTQNHKEHDVQDLQVG